MAMAHSFLILAALGLTPTVVSAVDCRAAYADKDSCDKDDACTWCTAGAVPPACNSVEDAKSLPPAVFQCDKKELLAVDCRAAYADKDSCDKDDACTWCTAGAVPPACNSVEDAKSLPPAVFQCDKKDLLAVDCRGTYTDQQSCDRDDACTWCTAGAVPPACNSVEDAKSLPPAVFQCDKKGLLAVDCRGTYTDQQSCDTDDACTWCTAGAVPPACNSVEDAKSLPPAVFQCDKKDLLAVDCRGTYTDQRSCDKDDACTWCTAGAVPPACNSVEDAKSLPPAVFQCDKKELLAVDCRGTYADQQSCDKDDACTWCTAGAVPPACSSLEDAKSLPPAVFQCDKHTLELVV